MTLRRWASGLLVVLALGHSACVDLKTGGATGGTALYVHSVEGNKPKIYVYGDVDAMFAGADTPTSSRTITTTLLDQVSPLAWGGIALDSQGNRLYLVSESAGTVVRIDRLRTQNGEISSTSTDAVSFTLGNSGERLPGGKFGQASFDGGTLYVTEANDSETRIWVVNNPGGVAAGGIVPKSLLPTVTGDKAGTGVAAAQGAVFAFFADGNPVTQDGHTGARLRKGSSSGFATSDGILVGTNTTLAKYGSLAYDSGNSMLFVARHLTDASKTGSPILVFRSGQFATSPNQAPDKTLGDANAQSNLRVLAHPGNKDWLAALGSTGTTGGASFWLWKAPLSAGSAPVKRNLPAGGEARGLVLDGNN